MPKAASENITIEFTPAGLDYVRRVLGTRPYDEAGPLIAELEQQRAAQAPKPRRGAAPLAGVSDVPGDALEALTGTVKVNGSAGVPGVA